MLLRRERCVRPPWLKPVRLLAGVVVLCVPLLVACDAPASPAPVAPPTTAGAPAVTATQVREGAPVRVAPSAPAQPDALIALAVADAADRTGTAASDVRLVHVEAREWPDRALGCPQPGMGYAQAITPGYLILVEVAGQRLQYHTDHAQVVLCDP